MTVLQWIGAGLFLLLFGYVAALNVSALFLRRSWIPLIGGLSGMLGLLILPVDGSESYWWIPLVVDWGCAPGLLTSLVPWPRR